MGSLKMRVFRFIASLFLWEECQQVYVVHSVPGDYNLALLDYVEPQGLHWVGNCNEVSECMMCIFSFR